MNNLTIDSIQFKLSPTSIKNRANYLAPRRIVDGIMCNWSAGAKHAMCHSYDWNWSFYAEIDSIIRASKFTVFPMPKDEEVQITTRYGYTLTTPYQTVIDLIRWDCEAEFVMQSLEYYERIFGSLDDIWRGLEQRNLMEKYEEDYGIYREDWIEIW